MSVRGLYGFHDSGGEHLIIDAGRTGWTIETEAVGFDVNDKSGKSYNNFGGKITVVTRLNNGYHPSGTIPLPQNYEAFAKRCGNFVAASSGCDWWIIGNEIAHYHEIPEGQPITLENYVKCFKLCRDAIKAVKPDAIVIPQAPAPWNPEVKYPGNENGDWVVQLETMLNLIGVGNVDAIALHAYSHGQNPELVTSEETMNAPFNHRRYHFRAYLEYMDAIPQAFRNLPVITSEANPDGWVNQNTGWVQAAYKEIDRYNQLGKQQIRCLALYRWPNLDREQFWIGSKSAVVDDFKQSLQHDYKWQEVTVAVNSKSQTSNFLSALDDLRFRASPGSSNKPDWDVIGKVSKGTPITLIGNGPTVDAMEWLYIKIPEGQTGWVAKAMSDGTKLVG